MSGDRSVPDATLVMTTRRTWSPREKRAIVAEIEASGGSVSTVARRHGINASLLFRWRRNLTEVAPVRRRCEAFVPVTVAAPVALPAPPVLARNGASSQPPIEIVLVGGRKVRVDADVDADKLAVIIAALEAKA